MFLVELLIILALFVFFFNHARIINKTSTFFLLFSLWSMAFLYSPYWHAFGTSGFPYLKYVAFIFLFLAGITWAFLAASKIKIPSTHIYFLPLVFLGFLLYLISFKQLYSEIPWLGDEDFHIILVLLPLKDYFNFYGNRIDRYVVHNPALWIFIALVALAIFAYFLFKEKRIRNFIFIGSLLAIIAFPALILFPDKVFTDQVDIFLLAKVLTYPFIQKWVNFVFILPNFSDISLYRIVPFLSLVGISSFLFYHFKRELGSSLFAFFFSFAFSTIPILLFYSSILYLEMPIVLLITLCVFNIKILIKEDFEKLRQNYILYILLTLSFLKESVLIFLLLIVFFRICYQIYYRRKTIAVQYSFISSEMRFLVLILSPVINFVLLRTIFLSHRDSTSRIDFDKIASLPNYAQVILSLIVQTGILPLIGVLGIILLSRKNKFSAFIISLLFIGVLIFFLGFSNGSLTMLIGYSRWNLYVLPMILFAASFFVIYITKARRIYGLFILSFILVINILLFPFKSDGVRLPNWGSQLIDIGEYTYPYSEVIHFLSTQKEINTIALVGYYDVPYRGLRFYFDKYDFHPSVTWYSFGSERFDERTERKKLNMFFGAAQLSADIIMYHSVNNIDLDMNIVYGGKYKIIKRVQNSSHSIYILRGE